MSLLFGPAARLPVAALVVVELLILVLVSTVAPTGALAELPSAVVAEVAEDGVFVAADPTLFDPAVFDPVALSAVVAAARSDGLNLVIVAPVDPVPDARAFALRVRQAAEVEAVLLFDAAGEIHTSVDDAHTDRVVESLAAARAAPSPVAAAERFVQTITSEPERGLSGSIRLIIAAVILLVVALVGSTVLEDQLRRGGTSSRNSFSGR